MRPIRLLLAITGSVLTILLITFVAAHKSEHVTGSQNSRIHALFDWRSPSSLFPPSAIISLTDDNSTFFLARPANFGPLLPTNGFSGQLWIGSGFGDDDLSRGGVTRAEGELGCSDVPGWNEGDHRGSSGKSGDADKSMKTSTVESDDQDDRSSPLRRRRAIEQVPEQRQASEEDGTDDHLHHPLPSSKDPKSRTTDGKVQSHADIQSIQESAEIAGKVVLLSRGGCGFLEKVKWVQRRGGTALIVGDNVRGGPLVTMYGRGDTSNVTIPSLFTSHTTAHLLSSLMPSGSSDDINVDDAKRLGFALSADKVTQAKGDSSSKQASSKSDSKVDSDKVQKSSKSPLSEETSEKSDAVLESKGWFRSIFSSSSTTSLNSRRPPSSGKGKWVQEEDFDSNVDTTVMAKERVIPFRGSSAAKEAGKKTSKASSDGFVIGVQDWRDPDLVGSAPEKFGDGKKSSSSAAKSGEDQSAGQAAPQGGSITPGSGEYGGHGSPQRKDAVTAKTKPKSVDEPKGIKSSGWLHRASDVSPKQASSKGADSSSKSKQEGAISNIESVTSEKTRLQDSAIKPHEGLWVTLQPTTISSSPFFDTLLVLVVSPLVTLTVVYALLLLRSRIRRRRWRAPKSVVERLPVRTYHTIASSAATTSSAQPSPPSTPLVPDSTTPLLHSSARPIGQRPRSRTTGEVPVASSSYARTPNLSSLDQIQEKKEAGLLEWKRKYGGKQRECVVCLEEYVDGVSRVMSLPCGHEFHADCITPWLTTRRRTCPICKGDVVRSLARANTNTPTTPNSNANEPLYESYEHEHDDIDEDMQQQPLDEVQRLAASTRNDDPAAAEPLGSDEVVFEDLERGVPDRDR